MRKQIPFRYPESLEKDFDEILKEKSYFKNKNQALIDAIQIYAELSRVLKPFTNTEWYYNLKSITNELIHQLKKISKKPGKKDIKNLDHKKDIKKRGHKK